MHVEREEMGKRVKGEEEQMAHLEIRFINSTVTKKDGLVLGSGSYGCVRSGYYRHACSDKTFSHTNT